MEVIDIRLNHAYWVVVALTGAAIVLPACSAPIRIDYVDSGNDYRSDDMEPLVAQVERPDYFGDRVDSAPGHRHSALSKLRSQGTDQAELADFITEHFPSDGRSVPFHTESASVDGREAWVIIEVWGSEGGTLDRLRLWAFDRATGDVIVSTTSK